MSVSDTSSTAAPDSNQTPVHFGFSNTYARLPENFYARVAPTPVKQPRLIRLNRELASHLGLDPDALATPQGIAILAGNFIAAGSEPLAMAYAGHQFGHFVPQLGDGRANLLGEVIARDGQRYDIHLKGSGPTPFSRRGDGRAALGPVLREYILSEAMFALGVPTTRALAAVSTGESVVRDTVQPGAIFTRVARSHLRVGTFQYFAARGDTESLRTLANFAIARHYPELAHSATPYRALLSGVISRHASLVAQWMLLGFIHGVMNTDNTSISGETIDYGPCAFMEAYSPDTVFSSIDQQGRYAYGNQPSALHWNLARFAETLLPLMEAEAGSADAALAWAYAALESFGTQFEQSYLAGMRHKLGFLEEREGDTAIAQDLLARMAANQADFTLTFRRLCASAASPQSDLETRKLFSDPIAFDTWAARWRQRLAEESVSAEQRQAVMERANPLFIPRNHLVEAVIQAAVQHQEFQPFEDLLEVVLHPFDDRPGNESYSTPARPEQRVLATFCGT